VQPPGRGNAHAQTILRLQEYWNDPGCALLQPIDIEVGAGTSHTASLSETGSLEAITRAIAGLAE